MTKTRPLTTSPRRGERGKRKTTTTVTEKNISKYLNNKTTK